jgi:DNA-binding CsgD family transcriptional regulator
MQSTEMTAAIASYPDCAHLDRGYVGLLKPASGSDRLELNIWLNHREPEQPTGEFIGVGQLQEIREIVPIRTPKNRPIIDKTFAPSAPLTERERETLALLLSGHSQRVIALRRDQDLANIRNICYHMREKFGAPSQAELIARAERWGGVQCAN